MEEAESKLLFPKEISTRNNLKMPKIYGLLYNKIKEYLIQRKYVIGISKINRALDLFHWDGRRRKKPKIYKLVDVLYQWYLM